MAYTHSTTVQTSDCDRLGHANNTRYVAWIQDAALAHAASLGWTWDRHLALGLGWVVRTHHIDYLRPALAGDVLSLQTWVHSMGRATSDRWTRVFRGDTLLARAETRWAFIHYESGAPRRVPEDIRKVFPPETLS